MECVNTYQLNRHIEELDKIEREDSWVESFREELIEKLVNEDRVLLRNGSWIDICEITDNLDADIYKYIQKMNSSPFAGVKQAAISRVNELWTNACDKGVTPHLSEYAQAQAEKMEIGA